MHGLHSFLGVSHKHYSLPLGPIQPSSTTTKMHAYVRLGKIDNDQKDTNDFVVRRGNVTIGYPLDLIDVDSYQFIDNLCTQYDSVTYFLSCW